MGRKAFIVVISLVVCGLPLGAASGPSDRVEWSSGQQRSRPSDNARLSHKVSGLDLVLALVRAFAMTARTLHFGRAAEELKASQQALSKRIA
ncbi:hypothetical protein T261_00331 [Streptomyces lydicus]|nr:hypothetical protein T261_00331 [Streptomyces lydicus]